MGEFQFGSTFKTELSDDKAIKLYEVLAAAIDEGLTVRLHISAPGGGQRNTTTAFVITGASSFTISFATLSDSDSSLAGDSEEAGAEVLESIRMGDVVLLDLG